jgi:mono/diheme cytochrome c family protein
MPNALSRGLHGPAIAVLLAIGAVTAAEVAQSQGVPPVPSASAGSALAERLCAGCHLTGRGNESAAQVGPPSFASIANRRGQTADHIRNVLIKPHVPMPDLQLTTNEIADIIAWLDTLRSPDAPPLLPRGGSKPAYPEPS